MTTNYHLSDFERKLINSHRVIRNKVGLEEKAARKIKVKISRPVGLPSNLEVRSIGPKYLLNDDL
jgi:hypothetical protein